MDFAASPDYESISAEAAKLAAAFDDDYWSAHDERKEFPWEFYNAFAAAGWVGVVIPEKYGGAGLGVLHAGALLRAVAGSAGAMNAASRCTSPSSAWGRSSITAQKR
jgi:acyl-CoA dehydrogenase